MNWRQLLLRFRKLDVFHINLLHFPKDTRTLIPVADMRQYGAVALGIKSGTTINIGLVDPYRLDSRDAMLHMALREGKRVHFYQISESDFNAVLKEIY